MDASFIYAPVTLLGPQEAAMVSLQPMRNVAARVFSAMLDAELAGDALDPDHYREPAGDPGWFGPGAVAWRVHRDFPSMLVGGVSSLMLQALHPSAMAGVVDHSDWQGDPMQRFWRTAGFVATTTFGPTAMAERAVARVRGRHDEVRGARADGVAYDANDPDLLRWVHVAEVSQFLAAHQRFAPGRLEPHECDRYLGEVATIAERLGATDVPSTLDQVEEYFDTVRPQLAATAPALETVSRLRSGGFLPLHVRAGYLPLARAAAGLLPAWARELGGMGASEGLDLRVARPVAAGLCSMLRVTLGESGVAVAAEERALAPQGTSSRARSS